MTQFGTQYINHVVHLSVAPYSTIDVPLQMHSMPGVFENMINDVRVSALDSLKIEIGQSPYYSSFNSMYTYYSNRYAPNAVCTLDYIVPDNVQLRTKITNLGTLAMEINVSYTYTQINLREKFNREFTTALENKLDTE